MDSRKSRSFAVQKSSIDGVAKYLIVGPDGDISNPATNYLLQHSPGTSRTYAYRLADHLRWLEAESIPISRVSLRHLNRYMGSLGARQPGPFGIPWREGKEPLSRSALSMAAACVKNFHVYRARLENNQQLIDELQGTRKMVTDPDKRGLVGSNFTAANPIAPRSNTYKHPKRLPDGAVEKMLRVAKSARDRMILIWLRDAGLRVGELCGMKFSDLHLRNDAACGEARAPHLHIVNREDNPNGARAKTKSEWAEHSGQIEGGTVRLVSPEMIHSYFDYVTEEYPPRVGHGFVLVRQTSSSAGRPLSTEGVRYLVGRIAKECGYSGLHPHMFRHEFATRVLEAANGDLMIAKKAGGWRSATTVEQIYGHVELNSPQFCGVLEEVWEHVAASRARRGSE